MYLPMYMYVSTLLSHNSISAFTYMKIIIPPTIHMPSKRFHAFMVYICIYMYIYIYLILRIMYVCVYVCLSKLVCTVLRFIVCFLNWHYSLHPPQASTNFWLVCTYVQYLVTSCFSKLFSITCLAD